MYQFSVSMSTLFLYILSFYQISFQRFEFQILSKNLAMLLRNVLWYKKRFHSIASYFIWPRTFLEYSLNMTLFDNDTANAWPVQVCLSATNHQMFRDVIMCLHGSMKDGLQENNLKASYISSFAGVFVVLVAKRGDGRKKMKRREQ